MLLLIVLVVMFMGIALLLAMYSSFLPFMYSYGNTMQYTAAYYGALSAVERGVLAASYAGPGFDGESGWKDASSIGAPSDRRFGNFYTYGNGNDSLARKVSSTTASIPKTGEGNVSPDFQSGDNSSKNYNALEYNISEIIPLGAIQKIIPNNYYKKNTETYATPAFSNISVELRLNPMLKSNFEKPTYENNWKLSDHLAKLPVVNWTIKGEKGKTPFTILPYEGKTASSVTSKDTLIRGALFNNGEGIVNMNFGTKKNVLGKNEDRMNLIASSEENWKNMGYSELLKGTTGTNLVLDLVNLLKRKKPSIYPFLEYKVNVEGGEISDRFFSIEGEGKVGSYNVKMYLQKPTVAQPALGNFTIIF